MFKTIDMLAFITIVGKYGKINVDPVDPQRKSL